MDVDLKDCAGFCRAYIDDIVIASEMLDLHIEHLHLVFSQIQELDIMIGHLGPILATYQDTYFLSGPSGSSSFSSCLVVRTYSVKPSLWHCLEEQ